MRDTHGAVIPSHMGLSQTEAHWDGDVFNDVQLHWGEVQAVIYPGDAKSVTKQFTEYDVFCQYRGKDGVGVGRLYQNCLPANRFGGLADREEWSYRGENSLKSGSTDRAGKGSKVLVACINGETAQPVILAALRDPTDQTQKNAKDLGHHYYSNFNGVSMFIDQDGQLVLTYNGKTAIDGTLASGVDKKTVGTRMSFLKDGSWNVNTRDPDDANNQEQYVFLDHANHNTVHQAKKLWKLQVTDGAADIVAKDGLQVGDATDHTLLGESFRSAQQDLHNTLIQDLTAMAVAFQAAKTLPTLVAAAAVAATQLQLIVQAINQFESKASGKNSFLSKLNKSD